MPALKKEVYRSIKKMNQVLDAFKGASNDEMEGICAGYAAACLMRLKRIQGATVLQQILGEIEIEILGMVRDEHSEGGHG